MLELIEKVVRRIVGKPRRSRAERHASLISELRSTGMRIGENVAIYNCIFDTNFPDMIEIGSGCIITHATVLAHDASPLVFGGGVIVGRVTIRDRCFIGAGAVILPGVTIGPGSVVGALSVVSRDVPPGSIVGGNPAREIGRVADWLARPDVQRLGKTRVPFMSPTLLLSDESLAELKGLVVTSMARKSSMSGQE